MAASESASQANARRSRDGTVGGAAKSRANCIAPRYAASKLGTSDTASAGFNLPPVASAARPAQATPKKQKATTATQPPLTLSQRTSRSVQFEEFKALTTPSGVVSSLKAANVS